MRNWNPTTNSPCSLKQSRFYSTYEELKRTYFQTEIFPEPGFYSTYEELKPWTKQIGTIKFLRFYSTYEELKQHNKL